MGQAFKKHPKLVFAVSTVWDGLPKNIPNRFLLCPLYRVQFNKIPPPLLAFLHHRRKLLISQDIQNPWFLPTGGISLTLRASEIPGPSSQEEPASSWLVFLSPGRSSATRYLLPSWLFCITGGDYFFLKVLSAYNIQQTTLSAPGNHSLTDILPLLFLFSKLKNPPASSILQTHRVEAVAQGGFSLYQWYLCSCPSVWNSLNP